MKVLALETPKVRFLYCLRMRDTHELIGTAFTASGADKLYQKLNADCFVRYERVQNAHLLPPPYDRVKEPSKFR